MAPTGVWSGLHGLLYIHRSMSFPLTEAKQGIPELTTKQDFDALLTQELVVIYKHSNACDRSWMAHDEMVEFHRNEPTVPLYLISVLDSRDVSRHVESVSGVEHHSPQVIIFRKGKAVVSASHLAVTADFVSSAIQRSAA